MNDTVLCKKQFSFEKGFLENGQSTNVSSGNCLVGHILVFEFRRNTSHIISYDICSPLYLLYFLNSPFLTFILSSIVVFTCAWTITVTAQLRLLRWWSWTRRTTWWSSCASTTPSGRAGTTGGSTSSPGNRNSRRVYGLNRNFEVNNFSL